MESEHGFGFIRGTSEPKAVQLGSSRHEIVGFPKLLNRVQRHTRCTKGYCLRKRKEANGSQCRLKFPFPDAEKSSLRRVDGRWTYTCRRNDPRWNKHNPFITPLWRANMDIQPVVTLQDVVNDIAKYAAKSEVQSQTYGEVMQHILSTEVSNSNTVKKATGKLIAKSVAEKDYSAQECFYFLMG